MARAFFEDVADALIGFLPPAMRSFEHRISARNLKVWFGDEPREHYEVQIVPASAQRHAGIRARAAALEVGFHAEHPDAAANDAVLERLRAGERTLRRVLGDEVELGAFVGRASPWRRVSELWRDGDLDAPETAIEAADRLARYITAIERVRTKTPRR